MEFENKEKPLDDLHTLAQTKKVTLQPMNPFLRPEDTPDPIVVNEIHGNIDQDIENTSDTSMLMQPSTGLITPTPSAKRHPGFGIALIILSVVGGVVIGASFFVLLG